MKSLKQQRPKKNTEPNKEPHIVPKPLNPSKVSIVARNPKAS